MRYLQLFALALLYLGLAGHGPAKAGGPNVLLIAADDEPRVGRLYTGVVDELSIALQESGFAVYGEAATADAGGRDGTPRSTAELVEIARSVMRPPLDLAVIFAIDTKTDRLKYSTRVGSQITARLLNVMTGQHLGSFQVASPRWLRVPVNCRDDCLAEAVEREARALTRELADQLTGRLDTMLARSGPHGSPGQPYATMPEAYSLVFEGFSAEEVFEIEEYLVVFSGYRHHRPVSTTQRRHEYWYETGIARGRLNRNLNKMLDYLNMPGQVDLAGNVFTVTKASVAEREGDGWDDW